MHVYFLVLTFLRQMHVSHFTSFFFFFFYGIVTLQLRWAYINIYLMGGIILFVYFFCKCNLKRTFIVIWWVGSQNTIENWYRSRGHISGILILKFYDSPLYIDVNRNVKTRESIKVIISQLQFPFPSHLSVPTLYSNPSSNFSIRRHISSLSLSAQFDT